MGEFLLTYITFSTEFVTGKKTFVDDRQTQAIIKKQSFIALNYPMTLKYEIVEYLPK